jgi:hypothetical protein
MMFVNVRRSIATLAAAMLCIGTSVAQLQGPATIKGVVKDAVTGKPLGIKLDAVEPDGKKFSNKSNDATGAYLIIANQPGTLKLVARGYNVERKEFTVNVPASRKAQTIEQDLMVKAFTQGNVLLTSRGFELNAATVTATASSEIASLKEYLRTNNELRVNILVSPDVDRTAAAKAEAMAEYNKQMATWKKEVAALKKKKVAELPAEPTMPAEIADPNAQLVNDRIASLKSLFADVNNADLRITYVPQPLPASAMAPAAPAAAAPVAEAAPTGKKGKKPAKAAPAKAASAPVAPKTTSHPTLVVEIGKVKPLFN